MCSSDLFRSATEAARTLLQTKAVASASFDRRKKETKETHRRLRIRGSIRRTRRSRVRTGKRTKVEPSRRKEEEERRENGRTRKRVGWKTPTVRSICNGRDHRRSVQDPDGVQAALHRQRRNTATDFCRVRTPANNQSGQERENRKTQRLRFPRVRAQEGCKDSIQDDRKPENSREKGHGGRGKSTHSVWLETETSWRRIGWRIAGGQT